MESMLLEKRIPHQTPILDEQVLGLHARFSKLLAWMEAASYMGKQFNDPGRKF
jgi:hypothetical protein